MTDASKPSNDNVEDSPLIERLTKRATEPIGVIDVRYAEEKYLRIVRWLARRNALLDHLKRRYAVDDARASGEHALALQHRLGGQMAVFSPAVQSFSSSDLSSGSSSKVATHAESSDAPQRRTLGGMRPSGLADILAERSSTPESKFSSDTFRVSRRPPPMLPDTDALQVSSRARTGPPSEHLTGGQPTRDASESVTPVTDQIADFVFRKTVEQVSNEGQPDPGKSNRAPASPAFINKRAGTPAPILQREAPTSMTAQEGAAMRNEPGDTASSSEQSQVRELANASTLQSLPLVLSQTEGDEHVYGRPSVAAPLTYALFGRKRGGHGGPPIQANQNRTDTVLVTPKERRDSGGSQESESDVGSTAAVAFEIPVESVNPEKPEIVWRTQQAAPRAAGSTTQESRFVSTLSGPAQSGSIEFGPLESGRVELAPATQQSGQGASPARAQIQNDEVQAEHISPQVIRSISERVIRAITLDLKLERERRGVTKWR